MLSGVKRVVLAAGEFQSVCHLESGDRLVAENLLCSGRRLCGFLGHALLDVVHCDSGGTSRE